MKMEEIATSQLKIERREAEIWKLRAQLAELRLKTEQETFEKDFEEVYNLVHDLHGQVTKKKEIYSPNSYNCKLLFGQVIDKLSTTTEKFTK